MSREIDAQVAEVMGIGEPSPQIGITWLPCDDGTWQARDANRNYVGTHPPRYSADIAAVQQVLQYVRAQPRAKRMAFMSALMDAWAKADTTLLITQELMPTDGMISPLYWWLLWADKPREICLAFLKANGVEVAEPSGECQ